MPNVDEKVRDSDESLVSNGFGVGTRDAKDVAEQLTILADKPELSARKTQLESLARALKEEPYADLWRGKPLRAVFADAVASPSSRKAPVKIQILSGLRMLLVFVPVVLTWWGIHLAASAYNSLLAENENLEAQSFFREWLEGFDGTLWLTFDRMAMLIAIAVVSLIVVWIYAERTQEGHDLRIDAEHDRLNSELETALTDAELHLSVATASSTQDVVGSLGKVAKHIDEVAQEVDHLFEKVTSVAHEIRVASAAMEKTTDAVRQAANTATKAVGSISDAANRTVVKLDEAASSLAGSLRGFQNELTEIIRQSQAQQTEEMRGLHNDLEASLSSISGALEHIANESVRQREAVGDQLRDHQADIAELVPSLVTGLHEGIAALLAEHRRNLTEEIRPVLQTQAQTLEPLVARVLERVTVLEQQMNAMLAAGRYAPPPPRPPRHWWRRR